MCVCVFQGEGLVWLYMPHYSWHHIVDKWKLIVLMNWNRGRFGSGGRYSWEWGRHTRGREEAQRGLSWLVSYTAAARGYNTCGMELGKKSWLQHSIEPDKCLLTETDTWYNNGNISTSLRCVRLITFWYTVRYGVSMDESENSFHNILTAQGSLWSMTNKVTNID